VGSADGPHWGGSGIGFGCSRDARDCGADDHGREGELGEHVGTEYRTVEGELVVGKEMGYECVWWCG